MVFIKRSVAKLELNGEEKPEWLKKGEASDKEDVVTKPKGDLEEQDEKESE